MTVISTMLAFVLISAIVGSVVSKKLHRAHQQSLRADVSEGDSVAESVGFSRPAGGYCKGRHFVVLRIAFTSKFSLLQVSQKPFKLAMTCPDPAINKPGMKHDMLMMPPRQHNWEAEWAWSKRKFLRHATILSTDFAGERLFWKGLPSELTIRVTAFRVLANNGGTAAQKRLNPLGLFNQENWMTRMARRQWTAAAAPQIPVVAGGGITAAAAGVANVVANHFWTMPFSEMLFHGSHDAGCIDTYNLEHVQHPWVAGPAWIPVPHRNVNCQRAINSNLGLGKALKGTGVGIGASALVGAGAGAGIGAAAGAGIGAVPGAVVGGAAGLAAGVGMHAKGKEPAGWCFYDTGREQASTQTKTIKEQLESGTRWFDIRTSTTEYVGPATNPMPAGYPVGDDNYRLFHPFGPNSQGGHFYGQAMKTFVDINQFLSANPGAGETREHEVVFIKLKPYEKDQAPMRAWLGDVYNALSANNVHVVRQDHFTNDNVFDLSLSRLHARYRPANPLGNRAGYAVIMLPEESYDKYVDATLRWIWVEDKQEKGTGTNKIQKCTTAKIHSTQEKSSNKYMDDEEARTAAGGLAVNCGGAANRRRFPDLAEGCAGGGYTTSWGDHENGCYLSTQVMNMC